MVVIRVYSKDKDEDEDGEEVAKHHYFSAKNLLKLDPKTRVFKFQNEDGEVLTLTPAPASKISLNYNILASSALNKAPSADATCDNISATKEEKHEAMMGDY